MKTAAFLTLGCKVNAYETNGMEKLFMEAGYEIRDFKEKADVYIINTCTVTNMADRKSRQMIHKARKQNPDAVIAAAGCYVQAAGEALLDEEDIDLLIGNNQKTKIVSFVEEYRKKHKKGSLLLKGSDFLAFEENAIAEAGEKTRAYIKIQDGCNQFCSYCIIPYVRGRIRSRREESIIEEIRELSERGYQEAVLTGIHLSSYGVDWEGGHDFVKGEGKPLLALLEKINRIPQLKRIRLGSLEPRIITEPFVKALSAIEKLCPHFHLSLQSGCDETLRRMNRRYTTGEYLDKAGILRRYFEHPAITTDIIVGFPQETEEEFAATKEFMKTVSFSDVHIFKYSMRKGTKAAQMEMQVEESVKTRRSNELLALGKELERKYLEAFLGKEQLVLVEEKESIGEAACWSGHNERYLKLLAPVRTEEEDLHNCFITVRPYQILAGGTVLCEWI